MDDVNANWARLTTNPRATNYTDAPRQHPNLLVGSLQLLSWLFFHPAAWHNHRGRIEPTLRPAFALCELGRSKWRNPGLRRLIVQCYVILPLLTIIVNLLLTDTTSWRPSYLPLYYWVLSAIGSLAFPVAVGLTFSIVMGLVVGVSVAVPAGLVLSLLLGRMEAGNGVLWAYGLSLGLAGALAINVARQRTAFSLTRQVNAAVAGALLSSIAIGWIFATFALATGLGINGISLTPTRTIARVGTGLGDSNVDPNTLPKVPSFTETFILTGGPESAGLRCTPMSRPRKCLF
jgi:hypothetical protein